MNLFETYARRLNAKEIDLVQAQMTWDRRASEVSRFTVAEDDFALSIIERHQNIPGSKVLDISFGGGRYLKAFLQRGAKVSGVEISVAMVNQTVEKLTQDGLQFDREALQHTAWQDVDLDGLGWREAFDLVFLYMSPAISSVAMLEKVVQASRRGVYLALYSHREDSLLSDLQKAFDLPARSVGEKNAHDIYDIFNILYLQGYCPSVTFEERTRKSNYEIDYILERYASWLWREHAELEQNRTRLKKALQARVKQGQVSSVSRDIVGHLYLDKTLRRSSI